MVGSGRRAEGGKPSRSAAFGDRTNEARQALFDFEAIHARPQPNHELPGSTTGRGVEFLMGYYGILDRVPNGRDEGELFQVWIRRHDEYDG